MRAAIGLTTMVLLGGCGLFPFGGDETDEAPGTATTNTTATTGSEWRPTMAEWNDVEAYERAEASGNLPAAPWEAEPIGDGDAPDELMAAWRDAENRDWCAPIAPSAMSDVRARPAYYSGGWAVEFDKDGMPGVSRNGHRCENCGRGAFGVAGTAVMIDDEDPMEAEERGFRDGSRLRIEVGEGEEAEEVEGHVATVKIEGQDCVYQVWSMSGDEHLEDLVNQLRFVTPASE